MATTWTTTLEVGAGGKVTVKTAPNGGVRLEVASRVKLPGSTEYALSVVVLNHEERAWLKGAL